MVKRVLKIVGVVLLALILIIGCYVAYVVFSYYRLDDNLVLEVESRVPAPAATVAVSSAEDLSVEGSPSSEASPSSDSSEPAATAIVQTGEPYSIVSYNVGFGAYSADYSFFMDGGTESRARSAIAVEQNINGAMAAVNELNPDFLLLQEVDIDGTRSHHINELELVKQDLPQFTSIVFAQNYDSPYLAWPLLEPHGANKAGQVTLAKFPITSAVRRSLPIEEGPMSLVDLDRCYSVSRFAVAPASGDEEIDEGAGESTVKAAGAGEVEETTSSSDVGAIERVDSDTTATTRELVIFNLHLSAYTSDGSIAEDQLKMLTADMLAEYEKGNWVIAGGDFNKDLLGNSGEIFGVSGPEYTWAQPIPDALIPEGLTKVAPFDASNPVASCRNADRPYDETDYRVTVDGFIVSDNVQIKSATVDDTGFAFSDHNPVEMEFLLEQ